ncbi:unnamed protein product [Linum trigynum]|uniref:Aminotransferase-like plant mobile domain-containing protein n=1 Tax=Linum trigynum TaxID=586398 RepID=A0AAV2FXA6_9ROSI
MEKRNAYIPPSGGRDDEYAEERDHVDRASNQWLCHAKEFKETIEWLGPIYKRTFRHQHLRGSTTRSSYTTSTQVYVIDPLTSENRWRVTGGCHRFSDREVCSHLPDSFGWRIFVSEQVLWKYALYVAPSSLEDWDEIGRKGWGSACLAMIYVELCKCTDPKTKQAGGAMFILQLWVWEHLSTFAPICPANSWCPEEPLRQATYGAR